MPHPYIITFRHGTGFARSSQGRSAACVSGAAQIDGLGKAVLVVNRGWVCRQSVPKHASRFRYLPVALLVLSLAGPAVAAGRTKRSHRSKVYATANLPAPPVDPHARANAAVPGRGAGQGPEASLSSAWLSMVSRTQAEQPHWITPLVTVTPRLEQEFRYDCSWQEKFGVTTGLYGGGKGVELVPARKLEVIFGIPSYNVRYSASGKSGFADEPWLVKYRLFASNEHRGNQILTFFLGVSLPTGAAPFSSNHAIITPTIAYGKGHRRFDVQSTLGIGLPTGGTSKLGRPLAWNTALQEHTARFLWPELEFNVTSWDGGINGGKKQLFVTPGLLVGRVPLHNRVGLTLGVGIQVAATKFHTYNHAVVFSFRLPF